MSSLIQTQPNPGDIIAVDCKTFTHYAVTSNVIGKDGFHRLIGASQRTGTVREEDWSTVVGHRQIKIITNPGILSPEQILTKARSQISRWIYSLTSNNCEHFVNWSLGLPKNSKQVTSAVLFGSLAYAAVYALASDGKGWKALLGLAAGALIGTQLAR